MNSRKIFRFSNLLQQKLRSIILATVVFVVSPNAGVCEDLGFLTLTKGGFNWSFAYVPDYIEDWAINNGDAVIDFSGTYGAYGITANAVATSECSAPLSTSVLNPSVTTSGTSSTIRTGPTPNTPDFGASASPSVSANFEIQESVSDPAIIDAILETLLTVTSSSSGSATTSNAFNFTAGNITIFGQYDEGNSYWRLSFTDSLSSINDGAYYVGGDGFSLTIRAPIQVGNNVILGIDGMNGVHDTTTGSSEALQVITASSVAIAIPANSPPFSGTTVGVRLPEDEEETSLFLFPIED